LDVHQGIGEKGRFDDESVQRYGHSANSVMLVDGTVVVSVFGGWKRSGVVDPRQPNVLHCGLAPEEATLKPIRQTAHSTDTSKELQQLREENSALIEQQQGQIEHLNAQLTKERCTRS
jgi:hypothetical protein